MAAKERPSPARQRVAEGSPIVQYPPRSPLAAGLSDGVIAKHVGVDRRSVGEWRAKLNPTRENPESKRKSRKRKGVDGRSTDTAKCGRMAGETQTDSAKCRVEA